MLLNPSWAVNNLRRRPSHSRQHTREPSKCRAPRRRRRRQSLFTPPPYSPAFITGWNVVSTPAPHLAMPIAMLSQHSPITRPEAALKFDASPMLRDYLGEKFHRLSVTTRRGELQTFESHISPLEYAWYARTC